MVRLGYFASLRERLDVGDEAVTLPDGVDTVAGLQRWLQSRGESWSEATSRRAPAGLRRPGNGGRITYWK